MLSKLTEDLPSGKDYVYEVKLDGQRTIAEVTSRKVLLYTRSFQDVTNKYPELSDPNVVGSCKKCDSRWRNRCASGWNSVLRFDAAKDEPARR